MTEPNNIASDYNNDVSNLTNYNYLPNKEVFTTNQISDTPLPTPSRAKLRKLII